MYGYGDAEPQQIYSETVDLIEVTYKIINFCILLFHLLIRLDSEGRV